MKKVRTERFAIGVVAVAAMALSGAAYGTAITVAHYSMGEADPAGSLAESIGGIPPMNLVGGVQATTAPSPAAGSTASGDFNATVYDTGAPILGGNVGNVIIEAWVNPDTTAINQIIFADGDGGAGFGAFQNGAGFGIFVGGHGGSFWNVGATTVAPGTWYHLAVVHNTTSSLWELYVDGTVDLTLGFGGTGGANPHASVGGQWNNQFTFDGQIDELYYSTIVPGTFNPATDLHNATGVVPEPSSLALLALAGLGCRLFRKLRDR